MTYLLSPLRVVRRELVHEQSGIDITAAVPLASADVPITRYGLEFVPVLLQPGPGYHLKDVGLQILGLPTIPTAKNIQDFAPSGVLGTSSPLRECRITFIM